MHVTPIVPTLESYVAGSWRTAPGPVTSLRDAATGEEVARLPQTPPDTEAAVRHAHEHGGPALRALTFRQRAALLKDLARHLSARREDYNALSLHTGATARDSGVDIDGGTGTLAVYASKGLRELPDATVLADGDAEPLGRGGTFAGRHLYVPRPGVAVQINAYNFPVWGMLEKLAPALLAGMPSIVKPAGPTAYLTERVFRDVVDCGLLPEGAVQLLCGPAGDLLDHLGAQDLVAFTGSAATAALLRAHPAVTSRAVRFNAEADSLNCSVLGPDAAPGTVEFELFTAQLVTEMTVKAGQKCTAIRRALVPHALLDAVEEAVAAQLSDVLVGHPALPETDMGPLVGTAQRDEVRAAAAKLAAAGRVVCGGPQAQKVAGADAETGAFVPPTLLRCEDAGRAEPHEVEAFGPVSTLIGYRDAADAVALAARGGGSLAGSVVSGDAGFVRDVVLGAAAWHGRLLVLDARSAGESTGHGTVMPQLVHGGPGRAGGGEELGGLRGVRHHMNRVAVQGSPEVLGGVFGAR